jgi:integrase
LTILAGTMTHAIATMMRAPVIVTMTGESPDTDVTSATTITSGRVRTPATLAITTNAGVIVTTTTAAPGARTRLSFVLKRHAALGPNAFVFGSPAGEFLSSFKTAWESLLLVAKGHNTKCIKPGARVDRSKLRQIDLHWHDLRHEGACRLLADGVDIRIIQLMLGHASVQQTQRYLNMTDEELRRGLEVSWTRRRALRLITNGKNPVHDRHTVVTRNLERWRARQDSNLRPLAPEANALSS